MTRKADPPASGPPVPLGPLPDFTPVPRQTQRLDGWTPERQRAFIEALADTGSVSAACKIVAMSTHGVYHLRRSEGAEEFREAWQKALDLGVQRIEDVAMDRALNGVDEPLYSYGKLIGTRKRYNDRLLMFMLRNRSPERFAEGRAKGLGAIGKMEVERLKKEWRAEWEAEQNGVTPQEVRASLDAKNAAARLDDDHRRARLGMAERGARLLVVALAVHDNRVVLAGDLGALLPLLCDERAGRVVGLRVHAALGEGRLPRLDLGEAEVPLVERVERLLAGAADRPQRVLAFVGGAACAKHREVGCGDGLDVGVVVGDGVVGESVGLSVGPNVGTSVALFSTKMYVQPQTSVLSLIQSFSVGDRVGSAVGTGVG